MFFYDMLNPQSSMPYKKYENGEIQKSAMQTPQKDYQLCESSCT